MQWQHSEGGGVKGNSGRMTREELFKMMSEPSSIQDEPKEPLNQNSHKKKII